MAILQGFEEISTDVPTIKITMTVMESVLRFNKGTAEALGFPAYVKILVNAKTGQVAVQPCGAKEQNAIKFSKPEGKQTASVSLKDKALLDAVAKFFKLPEAPDGELSYQLVSGTLYPNEKIAAFTASEAVSGTMKRRGRKKASAA